MKAEHREETIRRLQFREGDKRNFPQNQMNVHRPNKSAALFASCYQ